MNKARYRLGYKWEPSFDAELKLAVSSFITDDAFHQVFGEGRRLDNKAIYYTFIGLIFRRRYNSVNKLITVRKDESLVAFIAGSLNIKPSWLAVNANYIKQTFRLGKLLPHRKNAPTLDNLDAIHNALTEHYGASEDKQMQKVQEQYHQLILNYFERQLTEAVHYEITMIAIDPDERGRGHLKAMLKRLILNLKNNSKIEYISVTTYEKSKAEMYEHLGFNMLAELEDNGIKAWILKLPLI